MPADSILETWIPTADRDPGQEREARRANGRGRGMDIREIVEVSGRVRVEVADMRASNYVLVQFYAGAAALMLLALALWRL